MQALTTHVREMHFPNGLNFEADKPVRVSVFAPLAALSQIYSDDFPTQPTADDRYVENPAAIDLARQIYTHFFESISFESIRLLIRHAIYLTQEKRSDQLPLDQEQTVWDAYNITFNHLVAAGDNDPEAVQLYVDEDLRVTLGTSKSHKARVNATVKMMTW